MRPALVAVALATACAHAPEGSRLLSVPENDRVDQIIAAWQAAGLDPIGERCIEDRQGFRLVEALDDAHMIDLTGGLCGPPEVRGQCASTKMVDGRCRWGCAAGALMWYRDGHLLSHRYPLIVRWHGLDGRPRARLFDHEAAHWLEACTGRGVDALHTAGPVWGPNGLVRQLR